MTAKFIRPVYFSYGQKPIPSADFNTEGAYVINALNLVATDFIGASAPANPVEGLKWRDTNLSPYVVRVYNATDLKWYWHGFYRGTVAPANPGDGAMFINITGSPYEVQIYIAGEWVSVFTVQDITPYITQFADIVSGWATTLETWEGEKDSLLSDMQDEFDAKILEWTGTFNGKIAEWQAAFEAQMAIWQGLSAINATDALMIAYTYGNN